jgi:hypothetical protein
MHKGPLLLDNRYAAIHVRKRVAPLKFGLLPAKPFADLSLHLRKYVVPLKHVIHSLEVLIRFLFPRV